MGKSIINLGGNSLGKFAEPVTALVNKVAEGIGGVVRPMQTRRVARAEADASIIRAKGDAEAQRILARSSIEITELEQRALARAVQEQARHQENMENILAGAAAYLHEDAKPEEMDNDWVAFFFDKSRTVSDEQMQDLWSRVLAGEANAPGSFSKRTVEFITTVSKADAELFSRLSRYFCLFMRVTVPFVRDCSQKIYSDNNIRFASLSHLADIGLVKFEPLAGFTLQDLPQYVPFTYGDSVIVLHLKKESKNELDVGNVLLTQIGTEIARITVPNAPPVEGFLEFLLREWVSKGYAPSSSLTFNRPR